jgi:hypothetical protein
VLKAAQSSVLNERIVVVDKPGMLDAGMFGILVAMVCSPAVLRAAAPGGAAALCLVGFQH